ncbi:hypothetical protein [Aquitalea magnusonii]|uniref:hypothetical protein n=1 Tax=Aquitalea magnusonii TaxID=332411 RepID=UPI00075022C7|nr:hypothetical protein [Aquitalea magnusonii]
MNTIVLLSDDAELIAELRQAFAQVSPELRVVEAHEAAAPPRKWPPAGFRQPAAGSPCRGCG